MRLDRNSLIHPTARRTPSRFPTSYLLPCKSILSRLFHIHSWWVKTSKPTWGRLATAWKVHILAMICLDHPYHLQLTNCPALHIWTMILAHVMLCISHLQQILIYSQSHRVYVHHDLNLIEMLIPAHRHSLAAGSLSFSSFHCPTQWSWNLCIIQVETWQWIE